MKACGVAVAIKRLEEMTSTGWPVLISVSNKDFIGETSVSRSNNG